VKRVFVGNDVVDLTNPRTEGRALDDRFVGRVFDADEQEAIRAAGFSDLELWSRWAAKEAGFKAISKALGAPPPFVHRSFKVQWSEASEREEGVVRAGTVRYFEHVARVTVESRPGAVHAVSHVAADAGSDVHVEPRVAMIDTPGSRWAGALPELRLAFSEREADAVYSRESAAVRIGARGDLAARLGVTETRVEIVCAPGPTSQRPPRVLLDGRDAPADVSLSHDGRWIAWAIWVDSDEGETTS
jgi:phosphopantetheinyl transferase (holo-ACP synthase)